MPRQQPSVLDPLPAACRTARSFAHGGSAFHKRWMCFAACLLLWAPRPHPAAAQAPDHPAPRPMQFADLMKMRRLGDSTLSPNGKWVLFSVTDADLERNTRTSHLWVIPAAGGQEKPVTASSAGESRGRFSPDGKQILFTSRRSILRPSMTPAEMPAKRKPLPVSALAPMVLCGRPTARTSCSCQMSIRTVRPMRTPPPATSSETRSRRTPRSGRSCLPTCSPATGIPSPATNAPTCFSSPRPAVYPVT
jgi:hypothetical protein